MHSGKIKFLTDLNQAKTYDVLKLIDYETAERLERRNQIIILDFKLKRLNSNIREFPPILCSLMSADQAADILSHLTDIQRSIEYFDRSRKKKLYNEPNLALHYFKNDQKSSVVKNSTNQSEIDSSVVSEKDKNFDPVKPSTGAALTHQIAPIKSKTLKDTDNFPWFDDELIYIRK
ncbi:unnamed protein product [Brachionus calyciflorus]|uniref:Uncharacterized protein n=1 Tax=Brachionus calyciflorus TaxID=104777 RepID=A0A813M5C8_9BILA|nr:unnamed protein product [Brachionus calyciflorus]